MDYFEELEAKEKDKLEEEKYQELYQKQMRISRRALLALFLPIGLVFLIFGIVFLSVREFEGGFTLLGVGFFLSLLGVILYFVLPKKGNYERYKKITKNRGGINLFDISISVGILEVRVKNLELENQALKRKVEELERNNK
ncbi:MAG: hypothetical protein NC310_04360 [Roseburia sp.]|nr:hypothetical protein [Anaeroplasma bactoclasticum]MCM1196294.1 hypothetical protein [Roseburia sp.]MCM1557455.1 hypothetical protein [Anaeroplasma bactoclasticum]